MTLVFTGIGVASAASGASPTYINTTAAMAAGDFLVAHIAYDNSGGGGADPMTGNISLSAPGGGLSGTATTSTSGINDPGSASAGLGTSTTVYAVTGTIASGASIGISWTGTLTVRAIALMKVTSDVGGTIAYRTGVGATGLNTVGATAASAVVVASTVAGEGVLCFVGHENGAAITGDADTSNGTWSAVYGTFYGSGLTGMAAYFQSKVVTGSSGQQWNVTGASSDWITGWYVFTETIPPLITQAAYQLFNDGSDSGSVARAAQDTAAPFDLTLGDMIFQVRVRLQSTNSVTVPSTDDWQLQYQRNSLGWVNVTTSSSVVVAYNSASLTDAGSVSNARLTGGTGTFAQGETSETGLVTDRGWTATYFTELLYSVKTIAADVVVDDVITFRVLRNGATAGMTYTVTPTINVSVAATITMAAYQFFQDDSAITSSSAASPQDTPMTMGMQDKNYQLRVRFENTDTIPVAANVPFTLQMRVNGGTWVPAVTGTSTYVTTGSLTTARMTGGVGSSYSGISVETTEILTSPYTLAVGSYLEHLWVIAIVGASYVGGETIEYHVLRSNSTDGVTYAVTPTIQISVPTFMYLRSQTDYRPGMFNINMLAKKDGTYPTTWRTASTHPTRGSLGVVTGTVPTVTGPTSGVEILDQGGVGPMEWVSHPIDRNIILSANMPFTINLWGMESSDLANAQIALSLDRIQPTGVLTQLTWVTMNVELGTTVAVQTRVGNLVSTAVNRGDRFRFTAYVDDAPSLTMAAGYTCTLRYGGNTPGAEGDSFIRFDGEFGFQTTEPTGTVLYLSDAASFDIPTGALEEKVLWTSRGSGVTSVSRGTLAGPTAVPWQAPGNLNLEWYSKPLAPFTLDGLVRVNIRCAISATAANVGCRVELAVVETDGLGGVTVAAQGIADAPTPGGGTSDGLLSTSEAAVRGWMPVVPTAVLQAQRLRVRLLMDDGSFGNMVSGHTGTLYWAGTSAGASGDTWIQLPQTITQGAIPEVLDSNPVVTTSVDEVPALGALAGIANLEGIVTSKQIVLSWSPPTGEAT